MRKIEESINDALRQKETKSFGNTSVNYSDDFSTVFLHGNPIVKISWENMTAKLSNCGWESKTTKSRLNAILSEFTTSQIFQKNFEWKISDGENIEDFYNGILVDISL
jgi:hypothetical protein